MYCESCKKKIKKSLEVRWINLKDSGYFSKRFTSMEKLIEWVEKNNEQTVVLKVINLEGEHGEG